MLKNKKNYEKVFIIEPLFDNSSADEKIAEIEALVRASGAEHLATVSQRIREISPSTVIGSGKLLEIKEAVLSSGANLVVYDGELTPSQLKNVSDILEVNVINRTTLILDVFAQNAKSNEGKILVELAQLRYVYPRLVGKGNELSRLGGGIGTRGPGETQLQTDRRHVKNRILYLEKSLKEIEKRRRAQLNRRKKNGVRTVALVGYTNTGKSTLLNLLASSDVLVQDKLFATLDPTARKTALCGFEVVIVDTVGFVKELPSGLLDAFKSTLECAVEADLILNVADASGNWQMQIDSTEKTLLSLGASAPILRVVNKCDKISDFEDFPPNYIKISAAKNLGIDLLKKKICELLFSDLVKREYVLDYGKPFDLSEIRKHCYSCEIKYGEDRIILTAVAKKAHEKRIEELLSNAIVKELNPKS